jgi:hypothetical protein
MKANVRVLGMGLEIDKTIETMTIKGFPQSIFFFPDKKYLKEFF